MAMTFGWKGAVDTDLQFSEFYTNDHTIVIWLLPQYHHAYAGPIVSVNGSGNYLVGQGDWSTAVKLPHPPGSIQAPNLISRFDGASGAYLPDEFYAGRWYHLVIVRQSNQISLFLNGLILNDSMIGAPLTVTNTHIPSGTLRLGRPSSLVLINERDAQFYGMMDELAVYSRALTSDEIYAQFINRSHLTGNEPGLLAGWLFSPTPRTALPPHMLRQIVHSGQIALVATSENWSGSDARLIPLPEHHMMELPFLPEEAWGMHSRICLGW